MSPTRMVAEGEHIYFIVNPMDLNYRVNKKSIRDVVLRNEYVVIELWRFKMIFVPLANFTDKVAVEQLQDFAEVN